MAEKLKRLEPRSPRVWDTINQLIDRVNAQDEELDKLRTEAAKPARRATKTTGSDKE